MSDRLRATYIVMQAIKNFLPIHQENLFGISVIFFIVIIPFFPLPKTVLGFLAPVSIFLLFGLFFIQIILKKFDFYFDLNISLITLCFIILIVLDAINGIRFENILEFKYIFARFVALAVFLLVIAYLQIAKHDGVELVAKTILISACIVSILIILEGFGLTSTGIHSEKGRLLFGIRIPIRKATGVPLSDGKLGMLLVPALTFLLIPNLSYKLLANKWRALALIILSLAILIMQSRSGWLGFLTGLSFVIAFFSLNSPYRAYLITFYTFILSLLFFTPLGEAIFNGFVGEGIQADSAEGRLLGAQQALQASTSNFILGQGHGTVFIENELGKVHIIHNLFLDQLASNGIIGLIVLLFVYLFFIYLIFFALNKCQINSKDKFILIWLVTCWASVFVEQNLYRGFYNEYISVYLALAVHMAPEAANKKCLFWKT